MTTMTTPWQRRVESGDWEAIAAEMNAHGGALLPRLLTATEAARLRRLYADDDKFRATVDMDRHRYGLPLAPQHEHVVGQRRGLPVGADDLALDAFGAQPLPPRVV